MNKRERKATFKANNPDQLSLLPPSLEELIEPNHVVRVVREVIDNINIDSIIKKYKGGGASSFHPKMMLKVLVYGYLCNIYSSRKIEQAVGSSIHFMWLAGMQRPDHNTINRFRTDKLQGVLKEVFSQVVMLMSSQGMMDMKTVYVDGTKLEANANKYTFVWGKSTQRGKERIKEQLEELWKYAESVAKEELMDNVPTTFAELDAAQVSQTIKSIDEALKDKPIDPKIRKKINYARRNWPNNMAKYKQQEQVLGQRNSYSKTDPDATFMRMKDDHLGTGQLKAGYNLQISTSNQIIVNYDIFQNRSDIQTLPQHLDQYKHLYGYAPEVVVADAGYGSEENYEYMEAQQIEGYVKYYQFHKEQKSEGKIPAADVFATQHLYYNKEEDIVICPMGQKMTKRYEKCTSQSGFKQVTSVYQAQNCQNCPVRGVCHKSNYNRTITIKHNLNKLRNKAKEKLLSSQGRAHCSQRPVDVEPVFGNIKQNKKFTRFNLRGKDKVLIEAGLLAFAHNLAKLAKN